MWNSDTLQSLLKKRSMDRDDETKNALLVDL